MAKYGSKLLVVESYCRPTHNLCLLFNHVPWTNKTVGKELAIKQSLHFSKTNTKVSISNRGLKLSITNITSGIPIVDRLENNCSLVGFEIP